jgi:sulfur carrier protein
MQVMVNDKAHEVPTNSTVSGLLDSLGYTDKRIAVERNGTIVPKSLHPYTTLAPQDRIEIVVAVGGG